MVENVAPIAIALLVFACVFGGALLGMFLRTILPDHHLKEDSKDVVKVVTGLIATLSAMVLGLLIASAKSSFDTINEGLRHTAAKVILLDLVLAQYGPETKDVRDLIRRSFAARMAVLLPEDKSKRETLGSPQGTAAVEGVENRVRALSPQNDAQRSLQSRALQISGDVAQARWLAIEQLENTIPTVFLVVLVFWVATMFASFGLFAPPQRSRSCGAVRRRAINRGRDLSDRGVE
jgi:hypothetical protein